MEQQDIEHAAALLRLLGETGRLRVRVRVDANASYVAGSVRAVRVETQLLVDDVVVACDSETCEL